MTEETPDYTPVSVDTTFAAFHQFWKLQCERDVLKKRLDAVDAALATMQKELEGKNSDVFSFLDTRTVRKVDAKHIDWIRENLPDVYDKCITFSNSDVGKFMFDSRGRKQVCWLIKFESPDFFREHAKINITDFDAAVGGKEKAKQYENKAYSLNIFTKEGSRLMLINPSEHPELLVLMEGDDELKES